MKDNGSIPLRRTSLPNCSERCHESRGRGTPGVLAGSLPATAELTESCAAEPRYASSCARSVMPDSRSAVVGLRIGGRQAGDQCRAMVAAGKQQRDQRRVDPYVAGTHVDQYALHRVREFDDVVEFEEACRALDRVGGPEHGVECLRVVGSLLQAQQRIFHRIEKLAAFRDEGLKARLHFHHRFPSGMTTASAKYGASR